MFARIYSGGVIGVDAYTIEVEVDSCGGIGQMHVVGLPDAAVKESQERVRSAIRSCKYILPPGKKWVINLAPADTRKEGPCFDLPIAAGILASVGLLSPEYLSDFWAIGELGLDGSVRPVYGVLPVALQCQRSGARGIIVPEENAMEASLVSDIEVYSVSHLKEALLVLERPESLEPVLRDRQAFNDHEAMPNSVSMPDLKDVKGQFRARRALEIAAAGRHNLLFVGPPGSGKSMLAERLPGIMPPMTYDEAVEVTKLYSVAGELDKVEGLVSHRPFRSPHHSSSNVGLVGGGRMPRPGEISLSHLGILFLDELTEFPRSQLDCLRQPMETHRVTISRAYQTITYPASFLFVGACNPCPCGYRNDPVKYCVCTPSQADRYWSRISGPLLDRIDLLVDVPRLSDEELATDREHEPSRKVRLRVRRAYEMQRRRGTTGIYNAYFDQSEMRRFCRVDVECRDLLARAVSQLGLSARAYDRILRVARTIADLEGTEEIRYTHIAESVRYRARPMVV